VINGRVNLVKKVLFTVFKFWATECILLYVQVTVHHDKFRIKQPTRCIKYPDFILSYNSTCFRYLLCPSSGVICCTHGNWYVSCRLCDRFLAEAGCSNLTLLGSENLLNKIHSSVYHTGRPTFIPVPVKRCIGERKCSSVRY
jgi:hypothetical protein